ncbi:MAG: roadblock/LC7 domain-containing protein [Rhodanobacteraceae bacterium]|nr:roadblock/LC7 domain-containing protein [Rhodanobacteraceae bacterium]
MTAVAARFGRIAAGVAQRQLDALALAAPGLLCAVLLSADGFEVASLQTDKGSAARLAAMASSLSAIAAAIAREAGLAESNRMIIESANGTIVLANVPDTSPPLLLAVIVADGCVLGRLLWATTNCCNAIGRAFRE